MLRRVILHIFPKLQIIDRLSEHDEDWLPFIATPHLRHNDHRRLQQPCDVNYLYVAYIASSSTSGFHEHKLNQVAAADRVTRTRTATRSPYDYYGTIDASPPHDARRVEAAASRVAGTWSRTSRSRIELHPASTSTTTRAFIPTHKSNFNTARGTPTTGGYERKGFEERRYLLQ